MTSPLLQRLCALIAETPVTPSAALPHVRPAFVDTLAVTCAGWAEPVARKVAATVPGGERLRPLGPVPAALDHAALLYGCAGHALDYDDVHLASSTHPSVPLVAALLPAVRRFPERLERLPAAFAIGLATNVALGQALGYAHYEKGWHATSTIGPLAAAASLAHLLGLDALQAAQALALAAAQAAGLQRNFGTMAKPLQAGLAAAAGVRAALLAQAGVTGDPDVLGPKGYLDLYGGARPGQAPDSIQPDLHAGGICVKLYPCCYQSHRAAAAALSARQQLRQRGTTLEQVVSVQVLGSPGTFVALRVQDPQTGNDGKFCGPYVVACALQEGTVNLSHFTDQAVRRPDLRALAGRVTFQEQTSAEHSQGDIRGAPLRLVARDGAGQVLASVEQSSFPGSPDSPITPQQLQAKVRDCLAHFRSTTGQRLGERRFRGLLDGLFGTAQAAGGASSAAD